MAELILKRVVIAMLSIKGQFTRRFYEVYSVHKIPSRNDHLSDEVRAMSFFF